MWLGEIRTNRCINQRANAAIGTNAKMGLNVLIYSITIIISVSLKYHYSIADSVDLDWILRPIAGVVETIAGIPFIREAHTGYVNLKYGIIIAPGCAGVNFLIIALCMAVFTCTHHMITHGEKVLCLMLSLFFSYGLAIGVNAMRIVISIYHYTADINNSWFNAARLHRIEGVFIYFFVLCLFYFFLRQIVIEYVEHKRSEYQTLEGQQLDNSASGFLLPSGLIPLFWYLGITLIVPLTNAAYKGNFAQFIEHGATILGVCGIVCGAIFLLKFILCYGKKTE